MVTEYKVLRQELYKIFDNQIKTLSITVTVLGIVYGIIFTDYKQLSELFLIIPIIIIPLGLRFQYASRGTVILSRYLVQLESQIRRKKHPLEWQGWTGFQTYYMENEHSETIDKVYDLLPKLLVFIILPMGIAFVYSVINYTYLIYGIGYYILIFLSIGIFYFVEKKAKEETLQLCPNIECNARVYRKFKYCPRCGAEICVARFAMKNTPMEY